MICLCLYGIFGKEDYGGDDFFVNKLGCKSSVLAQNPSLVSNSLEKRLIPRALVWQFLVYQGSVKKSFRRTRFLDAPENKFLQLFGNHNAESAKILKLYKEKLRFQTQVLHGILEYQFPLPLRCIP